MHGLAVVCRKADRILDLILGVILFAVLAYSAFGLWDNWQIIHSASASSALTQYKPQGTPEEAAQSLSQLQAINPDVLGWLTVDGTKIDYPLVQGENNLEYINRSVEGEFTLSGSVFLDSRNAADFSDCYSLIYAHHMEGGVMFGQLPEYQQTSFFEKHRTGTINLGAQSRQLRIFACLNTDAYDKNVYDPAVADTPEGQALLVDYLRENAVQFEEPELGDGIGLVALSTCYDTTTNGRILVFGTLEPAA